MFVFDDSSSMTSEYFTPVGSGSFHDRSRWWHDWQDADELVPDYSGGRIVGDPADTNTERQEDLRMYWKSQWAPYAGLYYDPAYTYKPWPTMPDADPDNPLKEAGQSTSYENMSVKFIDFDNGGTNIVIPRAHYYVYSDTENKPYLVTVDAGQIKYYAVTGITGTDYHEEVTQLTLDTTPPDDVVPKTAMGTPRTYTEERQNFANYFRICQQIMQPVLPVRLGGLDETQTLLDMIIAFDNSSGTPLRGGLYFVGRYFDKDDGYKIDGTSGDDSPWASVAEGGECQQAFAVVMTDGFWDDDDEDNSCSTADYSTFQLVGNVDGNNDTAFDGTPYGDTESNMLADYAMHYYERDLASTLGDMVPTNPHDSATHQHLVTYGIAFGLTGDFNPDDYDKETLEDQYGNTPNWDSGNKIDDLWHASVNGRGDFVVATNTGELVNSFISVMQNIESRITSASSVSVNGDQLYGRVGSDILMFQSTYNPSSWLGDMKAYRVDTASGAILWESYEWSARLELDNKLWTTRAIATWDPTATKGREFQFNKLTLAEKAILDPDPLISELIVQYLRGNRDLEEQNGGPFRNRFGVLGDVVHSSPIFNNGYLYVGANDGMMHCLDVTTGEEVFAYVPYLVYNNLGWYVDLGYKFDHHFYVDLSPVITPDVDAGMGSTITLLVGGLGKGGKGYYALNVTNPAAMTTDTAVASKVLWEFGNDDDMGYSYSKPTVVNSNDDDLNSDTTGWVVITGNGYNSVNGNAVLFILDPFDGTVLRRIDVGGGSCNGLSTPAAIDANSDGKVDYVYAGDLKGNMWKFDLTDPDSTNWDVAYNDGGTPKPLFQTPGQPITTQPDVMEHCDKPGYMVIFGTGKLLGSSDLYDTSLQSIFGIWDYGDEDDPSEYLGTFTRGATPQLSNQPNTVTLLRQTYVPSSEADPMFWTVGDNKLRILTANEPDWTTTTFEADGVTCTGAGAGTDPCDRNTTGDNPDPVKNVGWYFDLPIDGERVVSDVMIRENKVIVLSYNPEGDPCGSGGTSIIHEIDACSGGRMVEAQFDIDDSGTIGTGDLINIGTVEDPIWVAPSGLLKDGRLQPPAILSLGNEAGDEMKYYSSSSGEIEGEIGPQVTLGIGHWKEYR
jgi:type IV pilus assembly protein PilY1